MEIVFLVAAPVAILALFLFAVYVDPFTGHFRRPVFKRPVLSKKFSLHIPVRLRHRHP
jgi:hypothetical protein